MYKLLWNHQYNVLLVQHYTQYRTPLYLHKVHVQIQFKLKDLCIKLSGNINFQY